jgi:aldehyde:ferredoxin oxidoreductase
LDDAILRFNSVYLFPHAEALRLITGCRFLRVRFVRFANGAKMERLYNYREGLTRADDSLPARLTKTPQIQTIQKPSWAGQDAAGVL